MTRLSLNARILIGALLWTAGLFALAGLFHEFTHDGLMPGGHHARGVAGRLPAPITAAAGVLGMVLGFLLVRRGLSPINHLRDRLAAVHAGRGSRVSGSYPAEVQPLVDDLNALLEDRERRVARASAKAADLAHGLKTPLAVLAHEASQARAAGQGPLGAAIDQQIDRMRRQVDVHLAQAAPSPRRELPVRGPR
jgi:signal transduction histidine kinase